MADIHEIEERIVKCEKILSENPGSQIFAALAEAHRKKGDIDTAFQVCKKGLATHPNYGSAHVVMAKINIDKGLYDWAETEVDKAINLGGNASAVESLRCEILIGQGEIEKAVARLSKSVKKDPHNHQLKTLLNMALEAPRPSVKAAFPSGPATIGEAQAEEAAKPKSKSGAPRSITAGEMLDIGIKIGSVFGAIHQSKSGVPFDSRWHNVAPEEGYAVVASESHRLFQEATERAQFGELESVLVESGNLIIYLLLRGDDQFVFFAENSVNSSRLRGIINKAWKSYLVQFSAEGTQV